MARAGAFPAGSGDLEVADIGPAHTCQRPEQARTQLTDPKTGAEVPLAGLSFGEQRPWERQRLSKQ